MTDKVQKIKDWICKQQDGLMDAQGNFEYPEHEGAYHILCNLDAYIDSLQEEPAPKIFEDMLNAKTPAESLDISAEEHDKIIDLCLYGKEPEMVDIDDLPKEQPVSDDEIEKKFKVGDVVVYVSRQPAYSGLYLLGNPNDLSIGYSNANEPYQIALRNCTVASEDERKQFMRELESNGYEWNEDTLRIEKVEPVSEELEEAAKNHAVERYRATRDMVLAEKCKWSFKAGAEWQKTKDESTTEDLGEYINELSKQFPEVSFAKLSRIAVRVVKWQKEHLWKHADDDDLPIIDREVIALLDNGKVVFAHRPPEYWDGKNIITGKVTRNYPKTYDKGGWNIPDTKWWLDVELPKEIKL